MDWSTIVMKMLLCLFVSALIGGVIGWFLKKLFCGKRITELEASLASRDSEMAGLRASLTKSKSDASAENTKDDAEIADLKKKVASLESDLSAKSRLEADLNVSRDKVVALEADLKAKSSLEAENKELRESLSKAKGAASAENTKDDAEIADLKKKVASLQADLDAKGKVEAELTELKASLGKAKSDAHAENARDDAEIAQLKSKIASLESDLKAAGEKHSSLEADLSSKAAALAAVPAAGSVIAISKYESLKADHAKIKSQLSEMEGEKAFLLERVKKAESGETITRKLPESEWDDLELVYGIGPVLERMLYDMGIYTFKEIAQWDAAKIAEIDEKLPQFKGRIEREGWVESAKEEHFKKYGEKL